MAEHDITANEAQAWAGTGFAAMRGDPIARAVMSLLETHGEQQKRIEALEAAANPSAADVLTDAGCFAGQHGLQGLADADAFWDQQPYGTRLYYGDGVADYLHRGVLRSAIEALEAAASAPTDHFVDANKMVPAPAGELVEVMAAAIGRDRAYAKGVILVVACWLEVQDGGAGPGSEVALWLREEVESG